MQLASSASQRLNAVLATMPAVQNAVGQYTREDVIRIAKMAREALELRLGMATVLMELAVCHADGRQKPIVFPSNAYLEQRCRIVERTIREITSKLVAQRLIIRRDSANQKRFSHDGESFGFDLTPMLQREAEFARIIADRAAAKRERKRLLAVIGSDRRQVKVCIEWLAQHSAVDTDALTERFMILAKRTPRPASNTSISHGLGDDWRQLKEDAQAILAATDIADFKLVETTDAIAVCEPEIAANGGEICRHKESLPNLSIENCKVDEVPRASQPPKPADDEIDLKLVLEACPVVEAYGQPIRSAYDLIAAGSYLRSSTGANAEVWSDAVRKIGPVATAIATIFVLQRIDDDHTSGANRIQSGGGLLVSIIRGMAAGKINLKQDLMKLRNRRIQ